MMDFPLQILMYNARPDVRQQPGTAGLNYNSHNALSGRVAQIAGRGFWEMQLRV